MFISWRVDEKMEKMGKTRTEKTKKMEMCARRVKFNWAKQSPYFPKWGNKQWNRKQKRSWTRKSLIWILITNFVTDMANGDQLGNFNFLAHAVIKCSWIWPHSSRFSLCPTKTIDTRRNSRRTSKLYKRNGIDWGILITYNI